MGAQDLHFERLDRSIHEARFLEFAAEFRDLGEDGFDRLDMLFSDPDRYFDLAHEKILHRVVAGESLAPEHATRRGPRGPS